MRLLEEERRARLEAERANLQIRRLQTVTERLAAAPTGLAVAEVAVREGREALGADGALVHLDERRTGDLRLVSSAGVPLGTVDALDDREIEESTPIRDSHASGSLIEAPELDSLASDYPELRTQLAHSDTAALRCVPLVGENGVMGVLTFTYAGTEAFDFEDRRTSVILGRQCAQALERSLLLDEERIARDRSERLQELTTSLSGALTANEVAQIFLAHSALALGANRAALGMIDHDGKISDDGSWIGDRSLLPPSWIDPPAGHKTPIRDAVMSGQPLYFARPAELATTYGVALSALRSTDEDGSDVAFVPLVAGRKPIAVAMLAWRGEALDGDDRSFIESFCSQCAQALDRAQRYEVERTIAETLQRSVLPETLPSMEGATVAARYLPGTAAIDVGGDWFDTIPLEDGRLGFVVGDVVGKGVSAASTMAQLRNGVRALTLDSSDPSAIVTKLNRLIDGYTDAPFATLTFIAIDPSTRELEMVSAGHLPPLVVPPAGVPRFLEQGVQGLPLGVDPTTTYSGSTISLQPGTIIVLYTDGLVERRDRPLDKGLELLRAAAADADLDPEGLVEQLVTALLGDEDRGDDVAVLAVGLDRAPLGTFSVRLPVDKSSLVELRVSFGRWLERAGIPDADRRDLVLATWEAAANAIEHARNPAEGTVGITASLGGDTVRVEVRDSGAWREPSDRPERGLGLHLIRSMMTSLVVEPGPTGTRVLIERVLSRERAGEGAIT